MKRSGLALCAVLALAQTALATPKPLAASFTDAFRESLPMAFHALPDKPSQKTVWPLLGRDKLSYQRAFPVRPFVDELIKNDLLYTSGGTSQ